jgi:hypothetical protein
MPAAAKLKARASVACVLRPATKHRAEEPKIKF